MSNAVRVQATGQSFVDDLLNNNRWAGETVTFGFTSSAAAYGTSYGLGEQSKGYLALSEIQKAAARKAINAWDELIAISLVEAGGSNADIRMAASNAPSTAWAYMPGNSQEAGDVWFGRGQGYYTNPTAGNYAFHTFVHELGHSLGLAHPHEKKLTAANDGFFADDGSSIEGAQICPCCAGLMHGQSGATGSGTSAALVAPATALDSAAAAAYFGTATAPHGIDSMVYSIMSYSSYAGDGARGYTNETWGYAHSPMLRDIAAVQHLYGADYTTRAGDTVYSWNPLTGEKIIDGVGQGAPGGNKVFETIWDGGGRDTIDLSAYRTDLTIDLAPGAWTHFGNGQIANLGNGQKAPGNVALAYLHQGDSRALLENAIGGSGNDVIKGNAASNVLIGGAGNDRIEAVAGNNILVGDALGGELALLDIVRADWISAAIPAPVAGAKAGNDILIGGTGNDVFLPGGGDNVVRGGGGIDTLIIDLAFSAIDIVKKGAALFFSYVGGTVEAYDLDFLATRDGLYAFAGADGLSATPSIVGDDLRDEIVLLYSAGLGRNADAEGLDFWSDMLASGYTLSHMAASMIASTEFASRYGNPSTMDDAAFVDVLYKNVLDRAADVGGGAFWNDALAEGTSRADMLLAFAVSPENREKAEMMKGVDADGAMSGIIAKGGVELVAVTSPAWSQMLGETWG
jgi:serralysin